MRVTTCPLKSPTMPCLHLQETQESKDQSLRTMSLRGGTWFIYPPLVMSLSGGCANTANITYKRLATMLAEKWEQPYCSTLAWMRCKLLFALLRSSIQCIRGARSASDHTFKQSPLPTDLVVAESNISLWTFTNFVKTILFSCIHFLAFYITRYIYILKLQLPKKPLRIHLLPVTRSLHVIWYKFIQYTQDWLYKQLLTS